MEGDMTRQAEDTPATVPMAQQAGAAHPLWKCAKPCAWTVRMLTALIKGVEGGKWFRLIDKVSQFIGTLTAGYGCDCGACCYVVVAAMVSPVAKVPAIDGRIASLPTVGCSVWQPPTAWSVNPHEGKTINRRAGCGRTARPVRREGSPKPIGLPYPYQAEAPCLLRLTPP